MERGAFYYPLYVKDISLFGGEDSQAKPNLSVKAQTYLTELIQQEPSEVLKSMAEALFFHTLAILHAPTYRKENSGALQQDWPRVPLPTSAAALQDSAALGHQIAALLDPEAEVSGVTTGTIHPELRFIAILRHSAGRPINPATDDLAVTAGWGYLINEETVTMPGQGKLVKRDDNAYDILLNDVSYWEHVPQAVWEYTLGGYPVLKKWLSYREQKVLGRDLHPEEARTFTEIARRIAALLDLQGDLDRNYQAVKQNLYTWGTNA